MCQISVKACALLLVCNLSILLWAVELRAGEVLLDACQAKPAPASSDHEAQTADSAPAQLSEDRIWVVSSRRACQKLHADCCCGLEYFEVCRCGEVKAIAAQDFRSAVNPDAPLCVVTHGSFVSWQGMLQDVRPTVRWIRRASSLPVQFVFFTWPSNRVTTMLLPVDVGLLGRRSARNGFYLARLISELPRRTRVCLMGHSHGARVTVSALHLLAGGQVQGHCLNRPVPTRRRIRTVLAAAAFDHHYLNPGERYGQALNATECMVNLVSRRDMALLVFPLRRPFGKRALSQSGWLEHDLRQLGDRLQSVAQLDVTGLLRFSHAWPVYVERPEIAEALVPHVFFTDESRPKPQRP